MATTIIGSLAVNPLLPIQARGAGSLAFGPVALPQGYSLLTVQIDLQQVTTLTAQFQVDVEIALDGATFQFAGGAGLDLAQSGYVLTGGVIKRAADDPLGPGPVRVYGLSVALPGTQLTTRQVRATLSCSEACTAGATLMAC